MGCDIWTRAERRENGKWTIIPSLVPFDWRSYGMYAFLASVNNYSAIKPISEARGLPDDAPPTVTEDGIHCLGSHSHSWLSVDELLAFDYDQPIEDRRFGPRSVEPGQGKTTVYRDFLKEAFFDDLEKLRTCGAERIVFGFDG